MVIVKGYRIRRRAVTASRRHDVARLGGCKQIFTGQIGLQL